MPPLPKPSSIRQRRNGPSRTVVLPADGRSRRPVPPLPSERDWLPLTREWWRAAWRSPMAGEYLAADAAQLLMLARLVDEFWTAPAVALAAEIRLQRQCFGLDPISRRRLEWRVERGDGAARQPNRPAAAGPTEADPREHLTIVW